MPMVDKLMATNKTVKIALVNPPPPPGAFVHYQSPLIGVAYIAAVLEGKGFDVTVIDCPLLNMDYEGLKQEISRFKPDIVGITSVTVTFSSAVQAAHAAKEVFPQALVVLGGPHVTVLDEQTVSEQLDVDVVVRGEGEQTMLELAELVANSNLKGLGEVKGITFRKDGNVVRTLDRDFIQNLDELPHPAYKHFPLEKYRLYGKLILPITTSRGCFANCAFCLAPRMAGRRVRARSPKNVVDELELFKKLYKPDAFTFHDETFTTDKERAVAICDEIKRRKIAIPWDCSTRVDRISKALFAKMKETGCQLVSFGAESGSQEILNAMRKGTTVEQNAMAIKMVKEAGMTVTVSMIIGYPGETKETLEQTLNFIRKTKPDDVHLSLATPYPGIELNQVVKDLGWEMCGDWGKCDMQAEVFKNPLLSVDLVKVRREFYKEFYSWSYILRQSMKRNFYSKIMARAALNNHLWRMRQSMRFGRKGKGKE
jgi:anaerobic magnesium-protoporphyrin IX monomethyl ester cyclase